LTGHLTGQSPLKAGLPALFHLPLIGGKAMGSKRILVVDAEPARSLQFCAVLEEAGYQTSRAESTADAVSIADRERPLIAIIEARLLQQSTEPVGRTLRESFDVQCACVADESADTKGISRIASSCGALAVIIRCRVDLRLCLPTVDAAVACADQIGRLRETERQLHKALSQDRATSIAAGVLMERFRLDRHRAIGFLRDTARSQRRRLADLSEEVLASVERINGALRVQRD
jgi:two-component system, response regulator PdtaR